MTGRVVAHAFFPPGCGADSRNPPLPIHFDDSEPWAVDGTPSHLDVESVGLHEIGHTLGLQHSGDPDSVMFSHAAVGRIRRTLAAGDLADAHRRYEPRHSPPGGRVLAATQVGDNGLIASSVDPDGLLTMACRTGQGEWRSFEAPLDLGQVNPLSAPILLPDPARQRLLLLVATPGGSLCSSLFANGRWGSTERLTGDGWFSGQTLIAVDGPDPLTRTRLAWFDGTGTLRWVDLRGAASVEGPFTHQNQGLARSGAPMGISGVRGGASQSLAVYVALDGRLRGCLFGDQFATTPSDLSAPGQFPPSGSVDLAPLNDDGVLEAFAFDNRGALTLCRFDEELSLRDWVPISDPGIAAPGSPVCVARVGSGSGVRLVFVAIDGSICHYVMEGDRAQLIGGTALGAARLRARPLWIDRGGGTAGSILVCAPDTTAWELPVFADGTWGPPAKFPI